MKKGGKSEINVYHSPQHTFRFLLIFFWRAAARTALPLISSFPDTGLDGRD